MITSKELDTNPDFKKLSYDAQRYVRSTLVSNELAQNQDYNLLSPNAKRIVFQELVDKPPVVERESPLFSEIVQLGQRVKEGDEGALAEAIATLGTDSVWGAARLSRSIANMGARLASKVGSLMGLNEGEESAKGFNRMVEATKEQDASEEAAFAWLASQAAKKKPGLTATSKVVGSLVGVGLDIYTGRKLAGAGIAAASAGEIMSLGQLTRGITNTAITGGYKIVKNPFTRWLMSSAVPQAIESSVDSTTGLVGDILTSQYHKTWFNQDEDVGKTIVNGALQFGKYFAVDYGFSVVGTFMRDNARLLGRTYAGRKFRNRLKDVDDILMNDAAAESALKMVFTGESMPAELWKSLSPIQQKKMNMLAKSARVLRDTGYVMPGSDDWNTLFAASKQWNLVEEGGRWKASYVHNDPAMKESPWLPDSKHALEWVIDQSMKKMEAPLKADNVRELAGGANKIRLVSKIAGELENVDELAARDWSKLIVPKGNVLNKQNVRAFSQFFLKEAGAPQEVVNNVSFRVVDDYFSRPMSAQGGVIPIPAKVTTPLQERIFYNRFVENLAEVSQTGEPGKALIRSVSEGLTVRATQSSYSKLWVENQAKLAGFKEVKPSKDGLAAIRETGESVTFKDWDDLGRFIIRTTADEESLRAGVLREFGLNVVFNKKTNRYMVWQQFAGERYTAKGMKRAPGLVFDQKGYASLDELFTKHPEIVPDPPFTLAPEVTFTDSSLKTLEVQGNVAYGTLSQVKELMKGFRDYPKEMRAQTILRSKGVVKIDPKMRSFILEIPEIGFTESFDSYRAAKAAIDALTDEATEGGTWSTLSELANYKGWRINLGDKGKIYALKAGTKEVKIFDGVSDAKQFFSGLKNDPFYGKDLGDPTGAVAESVAMSTNTPIGTGGAPRAANRFDAMKIWKSKYAEKMEKLKGKTSESSRIRATTAWKAALGPTDSAIQKMAIDLNRPDIYEQFTKVEKAYETSRGLTNKFKREILDPIFGGIKRKEDAMLEQLFWSGRNEEDWVRIAKSAFNVDLGEVNIRRLKRVKELFGDGTETGKGLAGVFEVADWKLLNNYFPEIRKYIQGGGSLAGGTQDVLKRVFHEGGVPKEVSSFFSHAKIDDVVELVDGGSLRELVERYVETGYRNKFFKKAVNESFEWLRQNQQSLPPEVTTRLGYYLAQISGIGSDISQELINAGSRELTDSLTKRFVSKGIISEGAIEPFTDLISTLQSLTTSATMSWRVGVVERNLLQIYGPLAAVFGNDVIERAIVKVTKDPWKVINYLEDTGKLTGKAPQFGLQALASGKGVIGKGAAVVKQITEYGMQAFANSDELTRAIGYMAVNEVMDDAISRVQKGMIDITTEKGWNQFMKLTRLSVMDPLDQKNVLELLQKGDMNQAKAVYFDMVNRDFLFPYRPGSNPPIFSGFFGRLAGMYQHFPVYQLEAVLRTLRNASAAERIGFLGRLTLNSALIYGGFNAVLGVDSRDFLWWEGVTPGLGPYFRLMTDVIDATQSGFKGDIARSQILNEVYSLMVPGGVQIRYLSKAVQSFMDDDWLGGFMYMASMPYSENGPIERLEADDMDILPWLRSPVR